jgi:hypothetical protein
MRPHPHFVGMMVTVVSRKARELWQAVFACSRGHRLLLVGACAACVRNVGVGGLLLKLCCALLRLLVACKRAPFKQQQASK